MGSGFVVRACLWDLDCNLHSFEMVAWFLVVLNIWYLASNLSAIIYCGVKNRFWDMFQPLDWNWHRATMTARALDLIVGLVPKLLSVSKLVPVPMLLSALRLV